MFYDNAFIGKAIPAEQSPLFSRELIAMNGIELLIEVIKGCIGRKWLNLI